MVFVTPFLRRAEEILDVASEAGNDADQETAILIDRQGGIRMLDPTGWSLTGLMAEFGAAVVYRVKRARGAVRVEGWDGFQRCEIQRPAANALPHWFAGPVCPKVLQPRMLQAIAPALG